jgi:hypothetical protein
MLFYWNNMAITISGLDIPLYCVLNFGTLVELQLDYKESKGKLYQLLIK